MEENLHRRAASLEKPDVEGKDRRLLVASNWNAVDRDHGKASIQDCYNGVQSHREYAIVDCHRRFAHACQSDDRDRPSNRMLAQGGLTRYGSHHSVSKGQKRHD